MDLLYDARLRLSSLYEPEEFGSEQHHKAVELLTTRTKDNSECFEMIEQGLLMGEYRADGIGVPTEPSRYCMIDPKLAKFYIEKIEPGLNMESVNVRLRFINEALFRECVNKPQNFYFAPRMMVSRNANGELVSIKLITIDMWRDTNPRALT